MTEEAAVTVQHQQNVHMSKMNKQALVVMVKNPVIGQVKTRLAATTGDDKALKIYQHLLKHTAETTLQVEVVRYVFYSNVIERNDLFEDNHFKKYVQCGGDLGERMEYGFSIPFKNEYKQVVMIGADCPDITPDIILQAFKALETSDFVIGPASDGGYYLLGMKKWERWIFHDQPWSSPELLESTRKAIAARQLTLTELTTLTDIDTEEDFVNSQLSGLL